MPILSVPQKISFYTLGCRLNQAETAALQNRFSDAGYEIVDFREPADVVVINTCTVTGHGDSDARRLVQKIHRQFHDAQIALIGCQSQLQGEALRQLPGVSWVVGNAVKMDLPEIMRKHGTGAPLLLAPKIGRERFTMPAPAVDRRHTRANLKVQDGCDFFCAFCEIPYARGHSRSREFADLLSEAELLVASGHHEIVLTGVNIGTWREEEQTLVDVLLALEKIPDLWRIRISSIEMTTIPEELFPLLNRGAVCRFLHVPAQSGSDAILQAMHRRHDTAQFASLIRLAAAQVPDICLGTDILVGFPGETDALFEETRALLDALPLAYFHVFSYSERSHARSRLMPGKVSEEVKAQRSKVLRQLSLKKRHDYFSRFLGCEQMVLFEEEKKGIWSGVTDTFIRVRVRSAEPLHNQLRSVRLETIEDLSMFGTLV
jgi:threonylcarbamoyladenosine tRNA methylthiotransferase MtaB